MRQIGHLKDERDARAFGDYLAGLEIKNAIEPEGDGTWVVWVYSEDQLDTSRDLLNTFLLNPKDPKYSQSIGQSAILLEKEERDGEKFAERIHTREKIWRNSSVGHVTIALIVACVGVFLLGGLGSKSPQLNIFWISNYPFSEGFLPEVRSGQVWRLFTPIFIHSSFVHILFNMLWLHSLGTMIETRQGHMRLALLVLVLAVGSDLGQYLVVGPHFGGMSGVVYGLLGYVWTRGKTDPASGLYVDQTNLIIMMAWLVLCFFVPGIANTAHFVGLVMGVLLGLIPARRRNFLA